MIEQEFVFDDNLSDDVYYDAKSHQSGSSSTSSTDSIYRDELLEKELRQKLEINNEDFFNTFKEYDVNLAAKCSKLCKGTKNSWKKAIYALILLIKTNLGDCVEVPKLYESRAKKDKWKNTEEFIDLMNENLKPVGEKSEMIAIEIPNRIVVEKIAIRENEFHYDDAKFFDREVNHTIDYLMNKKVQVFDDVSTYVSDSTYASALKKKLRKIEFTDPNFTRKVRNTAVKAGKYTSIRKSRVFKMDGPAHEKWNNFQKGGEFPFKKKKRTFKKVGRYEMQRRSDLSEFTEEEIRKAVEVTVYNKYYGEKIVDKKTVHLLRDNIKDMNYYKILGADVDLSKTNDETSTARNSRKKVSYGISYKMNVPNINELTLKKIPKEEALDMVRDNFIKATAHKKSREGIQKYKVETKDDEIIKFKNWALTAPSDKTILNYASKNLSKNKEWCHRHSREFNFLMSMTCCLFTRVDGVPKIIKFREFKGDDFYWEDPYISKFLRESNLRNCK